MENFAKKEWVKRTKRLSGAFYKKKQREGREREKLVTEHPGKLRLALTRQINYVFWDVPRARGNSFMGNATGSFIKRDKEHR